MYVTFSLNIHVNAIKIRKQNDNSPHRVVKSHRITSGTKAMADLAVNGLKVKMTEFICVNLSTLPPCHNLLSNCFSE